MITRHDLYGIPWIDLENPTPAEIHSVIDEYKISESCAIELLRPSLRAKVDRIDNYLFFVLHFPDHPAKNTGGMIEIDFVVHHDFIITTRYAPIDTLIVFEKQHTSSNGNGISKPTGASMFGLMINDLYDGLIDELTLIKRDITEVEERIFGEQDKTISKTLISLHRKLLDCKSALRFHHDILTSFGHESDALFGNDFTPIMNTIMHRHYHLTSMLDSSKEMVQELRETYDAILSGRTSETMRVLTLMSFMTFPLALLVAIAAFPGAPHGWHTKHGFYILVIIILAIGITMVAIFKKKHWL
jgi:magnesium transporter